MRGVRVCVRVCMRVYVSDCTYVCMYVSDCVYVRVLPFLFPPP